MGFDPLGYRGQCSVEMIGLIATGLGHIRSTASLAADLLSDEVHQITGCYAGALGVGHTGN